MFVCLVRNTSREWTHSQEPARDEVYSGREIKAGKYRNISNRAFQFCVETMIRSSDTNINGVQIKKNVQFLYVKIVTVY